MTPRPGAIDTRHGTVLVWALVAGVLLSAAPVSAQWVVVPYGGAVFGGTANGMTQPTVGGSIGWAMNDSIGVEADVAWASDLFRITGITEPLFADDSVTTAMGNAVIGLPWRFGIARVRPFAIAGVGLMHTRIGDDEAFLHVRNTHVGFTLGAGATINMGPRFGIRGDARYLRDLQTLDSDSEFFSLGETHVSFWRTTAGLSLRF